MRGCVVGEGASHESGVPFFILWDRGNGAGRGGRRGVGALGFSWFMILEICWKGHPMSDRDKGSDKTKHEGAEKPQNATKSTKPAHPQDATKPDVATNNPSSSGPPRGSGHRG